MTNTLTSRTLSFDVVSRGIVAVIIAVFFTACPNENKLPTITLSGLASVTTATTLVLTANVTPALGSGFDNIGPPVTKVELYDGVKKISEKTSAPYAFEIKLASIDNGTKQFKAKAYDQAGAVGESNVVTVNVKIADTDTTPPSIISLDPPNGSTGVTKDKAITVTFSEPMNQAATQNAFQSTDLPYNSVTFSWDKDGKILTILPNKPFEYLETKDPFAIPLSYKYSLTNTATDIVGNKLTGISTSFSTMKKVSSTISSTDDLTGGVWSDGSVKSADCPKICLGDDISNRQLRGFVDFSLKLLPSKVTPNNILSASLSFLVELTYTGNPYLNLLYDCQYDPYDYRADMCYTVALESLYYGRTLTRDAFEIAPISEVTRYLMTDGDRYTGQEVEQHRPVHTWNSVDVLKAVQTDLTNKIPQDYHSQYRVRFLKPSNFDGKADYIVMDNAGSNRPKLELVYLAP
jgi:hypothetical protein